ncbi:MAG: hypothetical protein ACI8S6_004988 [Myxococcota bacterium]|jgi:hypothetical protein
MSLGLVRVPASADSEERSIILVTTPEDRAALYRLRHQIYVEDMALISPDHDFVSGDQLIDPYDERSSNLLLRVGGVPAGSIRLTEVSDSPLEIDGYTDASAACPAPAQAAEVTRFMLRQELRGGGEGTLLMFAVWRLLQRSQTRYLLVAGKVRRLGKRYKNILAAGLTVRPGSSQYGLTGCRYELLIADLGAVEPAAGGLVCLQPCRVHRRSADAGAHPPDPSSWGEPAARCSLAAPDHLSITGSRVHCQVQSASSSQASTARPVESSLSCDALAREASGASRARVVSPCCRYSSPRWLCTFTARPGRSCASTLVVASVRMWRA